LVLILKAETIGHQQRDVGSYASEGRANSKKKK
jgi:hypothetical protein